MNKLPEKLTTLRKHYNLSQGDIASKLNVPVTEYMQWENGNTIAPVQILKQIADIFGVELDALLDNTKVIVIPESKMEQSISIPFNGGQDINATQMYDPSNDDTTQTQQIPTDDEDGHTKVMNTTSFSKDEDEDTVSDAPVEEPKMKKSSGKKKSSGLNKKKQTIIVLALVGVLAVLALVAIFLLNGGSTSLNVGNDNRIAVGDTYSLYVDNQGTVKKYGDFNPTNGFSEAVQVSAFDNHAAALTSKGTVLSSDGNSEVDSWKNIHYISAGKNHTVGVTGEGKVECAGNEEACKVSGWTNISKVYAGNGFTLGLTNDGEVKASGNYPSAVSSLTNVRDISVSDTLIAITKKDGTVSLYALGSTAVLDTSTWKDIQETAVGNGFVAGLDKSGNVQLLYSDEEAVTKASNWKNIKHIAANGTTLVAIDASGKMHGVGDNSHGQYVDTSDDTTEKEKLDDVKNIQVEINATNVVIKWDTVENASYYEVSVNTSPETKTNSSSNSVSVTSNSLTEGKSYTVTITAKSDKDDVEESTGTYTFTYHAKAIQLDTPSNITSTSTDEGWKIDWSAVEHADSYKVSIDGGEEFTVNTNSYTDTGIDTEGNHTVSVKACSSDSKYAESEAASATLQYVTQTKVVNLYYLSGSTYLYNTTVEVKVGLTYTWADLDKLVGNYAASQNWTVEEGSEHIYSSTSTINIQVKTSDKPVEGEQQ